MAHDLHAKTPGKSNDCLTRSVLSALAEDPGLEAVTIDRARQTISVATLGKADVEGIEERINRVLEEKRELFDTIFSSGVGQRPKLGLTQQEIFGLFDLKCPSGPIDAAA